MRKSLPVLPGPQVVPSQVCFRCDVCCRFPEQTSMLRPYFSAEEIQQAIHRNISPAAFPDPEGCQVTVIPHPTEDGYICPAFDPVTHHCRIYDVRPLDCQLYPFALMWDENQKTVVLGWDTLCPFLPSPGLPEQSSTGEGPQSPHMPLPATVLEQGRRIAGYVESEDVLSRLVAHPHLVTPFQPDVIVLHHLDRLTDRLKSSGTAMRI